MTRQLEISTQVTAALGEQATQVLTACRLASALCTVCGTEILPEQRASILLYRNDRVFAVRMSHADCAASEVLELDDDPEMADELSQTLQSSLASPKNFTSVHAILTSGVAALALEPGTCVLDAAGPEAVDVHMSEWLRAGLNLLMPGQLGLAVQDWRALMGHDELRIVDRYGNVRYSAALDDSRWHSALVEHQLLLLWCLTGGELAGVRDDSESLLELMTRKLGRGEVAGGVLRITDLRS